MTTEDPKTEIELSKSRAPEPMPDARRRKLRKIGGLLAGAAAVGTVLAGLTGYWTTYRTVTREILAPAKPAPAEAAHLSIVALPFTNLSGDPSQDYFADGITENLTTELSRFRNIFVIARNTAFTYKGKSIDAKEIGKELGVRYVLEGSVQRDQNRVRVNVQLIDAESGVHLWADRFDEDIADLFKLQDDVVGRLGNRRRGGTGTRHPACDSRHQNRAIKTAGAVPGDALAVSAGDGQGAAVLGSVAQRKRAA